MKASVAILFALWVAAPMSWVLATDWDSCASDLDDLRRAASDASDAAEEASSQQGEMENCDDFDEDDECDFERDEFESAANDAESELDTVLARFRAVVSSCDLSVATSGPPTSAPSVSRQCQTFQRFKGKLPLATILESCKKVMSAAECNRCLSIGGH